MTRKELYNICHDEAVAYANSEQWSKRTGEEKSFLIQGYLDAMMEARKSEITEKKKEYPKTYEECLNVLGYEDIATHCIFHNEEDERLFDTLYSLKVCRDAYWKIASEEMGLDGPWEPDWKDEKQDKFIIHTIKDKIHCGISLVKNHLFVFPTEKMRDAFYENFKELIGSCKELL